MGTKDTRSISSICNQSIEIDEGLHRVYFDLSSKEGENILENIINEKFGEKLEEIYCSNCKKKTKHSTISKVIHFPEIFIMYSKNNENFTSDYQTMKNKNEEYNLVCFIINRN